MLLLMLPQIAPGRHEIVRTVLGNLECERHVGDGFVLTSRYLRQIGTKVTQRQRINLGIRVKPSLFS
jgi:hypothetical protein